MKQQFPPVIRRWRTLAVVLGATALFAGSGAAAPSDAATAMGFHSVVPERVLDTRTNGGALAAAETRSVVIAGLPDDVTAVALNVTAVSGTTGSFAIVWKTGESRPGTSTINWTSPGAVANSAIVSIGSAHSVSVYNERGTVNLVLDLVGYYAPGGTGADGGEGPQGPEGAPGPEGPQGEPTMYISASNTTARTIPADTAFVFDRTGEAYGGLVRDPVTGEFTATVDGVFKVSFGVTAISDSTLALLVDGAAPFGGAQEFGAIAAAASALEDSDFSVNNGSALIRLEVGEVLTLENVGATSLTLADTGANNAWIIVEQVNSAFAVG